MQKSAKQTLEAKDVHVVFGGLRALNGVNLTLSRGTILGLIGPNGAGKTTMVNVLSGFQRPHQGRVSLDGVDVSTLSPRKVAQAGIGRSFQAARLFRDMTVEENLTVAGLGIGLSKSAATEQARDILDWISYRHGYDRRCESLPYSDERRVSIARALALQPSFALLDEPASGMNDRECEQLMEVIVDIPKRFGCGVMLIEHNMQVIMGVCERIHVLDGGKSLAEGTPEHVKKDPAVLRAYLGDKARANAVI
ncbi:MULTISPECIES: ABC transporter ATP-binding protein [unclassified Mesorhizobium]|uniref:ABC transporter ATP-binding protein n=1 Tax=unclassified Mesorhizobium TaxID=325217 RepID=UPI000FCCA3EE|nr:MULTISPECIES: ABC transporter ATP-binding protein [unclassified Mesorhizobium]TGP18211.1 ABC transporter ATP-binding protein [Mesorhizobium sp. M1D.F.Ca.ET.231.01.1.1]TGP25449.1 ABC transporter ATP-binding protein [Mesorhizobium sp. M1D.F.Ca.ET.234.01.1.1]TGS38335.1 ABC transporter ATP-binding protein [Mesorhizobium sp. M1D.F.Ca.ET.184.01.1.1]TGS58342.1 ABC transporter ATP-binding protein [Mesorhizobium sp. M1D.F.Ca.ET.183.01.1.1]